MKKTTFLLLSMLLISIQMVSAAAAISFKESSHDFGTIKEEDGAVPFEFKFTNKGNSALIIYKALASCGCTNPEFSKEPIAPGASSTIKVTYDASGRPGTFHKTVTVYTNDPQAPNITLIITGSVTPAGVTPEGKYPFNLQGLRLERTSINFLEAKIGSIKTEIIEMMNTSAKPVNIKFNKVPKHIRVYASNTLLKPGQTGFITLKYVAEVAKDYGRREDAFYVYTNEKDKTNPTNQIRVTATLTEDFSRLNSMQMQNVPVCSFSNTRINFGKMIQGTTNASFITLTNNGKSNLILRKIVSDYDGIGFKPITNVIGPGKTIKINLTFNAGKFDGSVVQRVTVYTNDPKNSISRIFLTAQVSGK